jgi:hypothetical protein
VVKKDNVPRPYTTYMSFDLSRDAHQRFVKGKRLYLDFSHSKNVSAVRTPYLPPETNLSRTYSVSALTQVGHHFLCSAQPHRASSSASPSPSPDYVVLRHSLRFVCVALFSRCHDAVPIYRFQLTQVFLLPLSSPGACALSDILRRGLFGLVCARVYAALLPPGL